MMGSLVEELQFAAQDSSVSVLELLRKAKFLAVKLGVSDLLAWVEHEQKGYGQDEVPPYRQIVGPVEAFDPVAGWKPVFFEDQEVQRIVSQPHKLGMAVVEIERGLSDSRDTDLFVPLQSELRYSLMRRLNVSEIGYSISRGSAHGIIEAVRNVILDWSLKLEAAGVKGDGLTFSQEEKKKAQSPQATIQIGRVENLGAIATDNAGRIIVNANQRAGFEIAEVRSLVASINQHLSELPSHRREPIAHELRGIDAELEKAGPDQSKISSALRSIRRLLEGIVGNLIATGISAEITRLVS
jgi:AbiTii-like protein